MKKIKILFGLEATGGGSLKHVIYLLSHLNREVFDITFVYSLRSKEAHAEIIKLRTLGIKLILIKMTGSISFFQNFTSLFRVLKVVCGNQFDIVHAHSSLAGFYFRVAAWFYKVPVILYTPHCFYFQAKHGLKATVFASIERVLGCITDRIIVSESERLQGVKFKIASENKFVNINNAIDFKDYIEYEREGCLKQLGLCEDSIVIGAIGRLVEQKDLITLVLAAHNLVKHIPNLYFLIAGEGKQTQLLAAEITKLGLTNRVLLLGHKFHIDQIFSAIDIFASTSLWEGLPYVILEAMYYRKPIVATDIGYQDVLSDKESGYLVPAGDIILLCERLTVLINDKKLRQQIGERNRRNIVLNFPFKKFVSLHELLFVNLHNVRLN